MVMVVKKLVSFTIPTTLVILNVLPFITSSKEHATTHTSNKHNKLSPQLLFEIGLHGFLLWASMGFLIPVGILIIRISNREQCGRRVRILFYIHAIVQIVSIVVATAGAVMSILNFDNSFNNNHQKMGLALYGIIWLQALIGFLRPSRGSGGRSIWFFVHWIMGTAVSAMGILNVYTGLQAYHKKTSKGIKLWTILFTAQISFIALFYLFQDKWEYIHKQGVILGNQLVQPTDQEDTNSPIQNHKNDLLTQPPC
ncbi:hypothetical protein LguiA_022129 [Lonicera macranthoides]